MALRCIPPALLHRSRSFYPSTANLPLGVVRQGFRLHVRAKESVELESKSLSAVAFQPFAEAQSKLAQISPSNNESLARQHYYAGCEAAINEQINIEYNISYIYHALFAYFDRDNVALPGFAKYFKESSDEEREHAEKFMKYQNLRGGRVKLQSIMAPETEFDNAEKGDALYAMELALSLEKLNYEKLLNLTKVAEENGDVQMQDFIDNFLTEQVEAIKKCAEYVAQLRRVGKGHGVYHFDLELQEKGDGAATA